VNPIPSSDAGGAAVSAVRAGGTTPDRRSGWSLLARLAWIATVAVVASMILGGLAMYWAASFENDQMIDARLEQFGATLQALVEESAIDSPRDGFGGRPLLKTRPTAALLYRYQIWGRDGTLKWRSHEAPSTKPMTDLGRFGYGSSTIDGEHYRVFSLPTRKGDYVIQVAENLDEAWSQVGLTSAYYAGFLLVPFGLVLLATWLLLRRALHAISSLAQGLERRNPLDLTPVPVEAPPRELVPILSAMDMLFGRMQRALSIERSFTSLAAHEMRTPLAGLRAQAQLLSREELADEPKEAVAALIKGVDRASHMVDQLLDLARVEGLALNGEIRFEPVRVSDVYQDVLHDLALRIRRRQVTVTARVGDATVSCHAFALSVLLRNLLSNAILYSPAGSRVELLALTDGDKVILAVDDSGQGIPESDRERAFERFNRLGRSQADGIGLGLSIVLLVVEMHRAKIQLMSSPLGGLRAQVQFQSVVTQDRASPPNAGA
jgi:two-component system OmpR family sensor kinase/two-component system sensor histidine kinase QseC